MIKFITASLWIVSIGLFAMYFIIKLAVKNAIKESIDDLKSLKK